MVREKKHMEEYRRWLENSQDNDNLKAHLEKMTSEDVIREAFHKDLEFGTSGLRGVMVMWPVPHDHGRASSATPRASRF